VRGVRLVLLAGLAVGLLGAAQDAPLSNGRFRFQTFNHEYSGVVPEIAPITNGPVTVHLAVPKSDVFLRDNLLRLEPGTGGSHSAELRVELEGSGWLVADVDVGGVTSRLQDRVTVPRQAIEMEGRVRIARDAAGYVVTPEQLPKSVNVRIKTGLAQSALDMCDSASLLAPQLDCAALQKSLSTAVVPLPRAGQSFRLEASDLSPETRREIDAYLAGVTGVAGAGGG
jgi:hypothetical protein